MASEKVQRLAMLKMVLSLLKLGHRANFDNGRLGSDLQLLLVLGVVANAPSAGRKATIGYVAKEMSLPRETARRLLCKLVKSGRIEKRGREYFGTPVYHDHELVKEAVDIVERTCAKL